MRWVCYAPAKEILFTHITEVTSQDRIFSLTPFEKNSKVVETSFIRGKNITNVSISVKID